MKSHRLLLSGLLLSCLVGILPGAASPQDSNKVNKGIEVRISSKVRVVRAGTPLEVQVTILNVGKEDLFIEKDVYEMCRYSPLSFSLELGPTPTAGGWNCASDCLDDPSMSFANRVVKRWIVLPAGNFYGTTVRIDPDFFPQLKTPGHWRLRGLYQAAGDLASSVCLDPVRLDPQQTEQLPYKAWSGKENTNVIWIEVVRAKPGKSNR
jgi:hypothetical protein